MLNVFGVFLHSIKLFPVTKLKEDQDETTPLKILSIENSNNFLSDVSVNRINRKLSGDSFDGVLSEAFAIYILLLTLAEAIPSAKQWVSKDFFTVDEWKVFEFLRQNVARIEVAVDGVLQRVYFPIRPTCHFISVKSRKALMQSINRESQQSKVTELMEAIPDLIDEMEHNEQLESATIQITPKLMAQLKDFSNLVGLVISLAQVAFLIRVDNYTQREMPIYITRLVFYLGIVQGISSFTLCIFYIINKYTLVTKQGWRSFVEANKRTASKIAENEERLNVQEMSIEQTHLILMAKGIEAEEFNIGEKSDFGNKFTKMEVQFYNIYFFLQDGVFQYYVLYFGISVLGFQVDQLYYSFHLLDVVVKFPTLANVVKAVTMNANQLAWTFLLMIITIYIFTTVSFFYMQDTVVDVSFNGNDATQVGENTCRTMLQCFMSMTSYGMLKGGGIGDVTQ